MVKVEIIYGDGTVKVDHSLDTPQVSSLRFHKLLDDVWAGMNRGSGREFDLLEKLKCRSMCVGDFIKLCYPDGDTFYMVDSVGFKRVSREYMEAFISDVKTLVNQHKHPFSAMQDILWDRQKVDA